MIMQYYIIAFMRTYMQTLCASDYTLNTTSISNCSDVWFGFLTIQMDDGEDTKKIFAMKKKLN